MQLRDIAMVALALGGLGRMAGARPVLIVETPQNQSLDFGHVAFDSQSASQRVLVRNEGTAAQLRRVFVLGPYTIVASAGGLGAGEEMYWDVVCNPSEPDPNSGTLQIEACEATCSDFDWSQFIFLGCFGGLLEASVSAFSVPAHAYGSGSETVAFHNPGPDPITITAIASADPAISGALATGALPVTLEVGQSVDIVVRFAPMAADAAVMLDVLAGTTIAGRVRVEGLVVNQISPSALNINLIPQGAVYSIPLTVRNSFPTARTITAVASDLDTCTVTGLVGTTLEPGAFAHGIATVAATTLGARACLVTVAFDAGQGDTGRLGMNVVPATFSVTVDDATPGDGLLDFGTLKVGSEAVERTVTITNLTAVDQPVFDCFIGGTPFTPVGACPTLLPASGSVALTVQFTPTVAGHFLGSADLGVTGLGHIPSFLSARVIANQLAFSATALAFPDTQQDMTAQRSVTITNLADNAITVPVAVSGAAFSAAATEVVLAGRATVDVVVEFQPAAAGMFTGALTIGVSGDPDHTTLALSGTGEAPPPDDGGGGCSAGGSAGGLALAILALARRRRRIGSA
jgi:hypothetical protein